MKVDKIIVKDSASDSESGSNAYPGNPAVTFEKIEEVPQPKEGKDSTSAKGKPEKAAPKGNQATSKTSVAFAELGLE